nr:hypothetical protein [uncultured Allomuricauda sp.]
MKKQLYILLTLLACPLFMIAQLSLNAGWVDVSDWNEGEAPVTWTVGYDHFSREGIGGGLNYRYTGMAGVTFYSVEAKAKYRLGERNYRLEIGGGAGHNLDDKDFYPVVHMRNAFRIGELSWLTLDFDNSFRTMYKHTETYLMVGIVVDMNIFKDTF